MKYSRVKFWLRYYILSNTYIDINKLIPKPPILTPAKPMMQHYKIMFERSKISKTKIKKCFDFILLNIKKVTFKKILYFFILCKKK